MRVKYNKPVHAIGLLGHAVQKAPLKAGAHMPMRHNSGFDDAKGYQSSDMRRNGRHTGKAAKGDSGLVKSGNSHGTAPPALKKGGKLASHMGDSGRGVSGKIGRGDDWKGKSKKLSEEISHDEFEKLGA